MNEEWRPIEGGYQVSSWGRIRNRRERIMKLWDKDGSAVYVRLVVDGRQRFVTVSSLICEAWNGPRPEGHQVAHHDCNFRNNNASNLRWATPKENMEDCRRNGCHSDYRQLKAKR